MVSVMPDLFCCHRLLVSEKDPSYWQKQLKIENVGYLNVGQLDKVIENFALGLWTAKDVGNRNTQVSASGGLGE